MPYIIKPSREIVVPAARGPRFEGAVNIKKIDRKGKVTKEVSFKNTLTDKFLEYGLPPVEDSSYAMYYDAPKDSGFLAVGTGVQTEPTTTDHQLGNESMRKRSQVLAFPSTLTSEQEKNGSASIATIGAGGPETDYLTIPYWASFDYNEAIGDITEVALAMSSSTAYDNLSRALIRDPQGTPIAISKTSNEKLEITYEIRVYRPQETTHVVTLDGVDYGFMTLTRARYLNFISGPDPFSTSVNSSGVIADRGGVDDPFLNQSSVIGNVMEATYLNSSKREFDPERNQFWEGMMAPDYTVNSAAGTSESTNYYRLQPAADARNCFRLANLHPTYSSRDPVTKKSIFAYTVETYTASDQTVGPLNNILVVDPQTLNLKALTVPADYRLDFEIGRTRGRN